jgi:inward rectifier potassium channel
MARPAEHKRAAKPRRPVEPGVFGRETGQVAFFALTWTVMHRIDEASPLHGVTPEMMRAEDMTLVCTMTGTDETFAQSVYARYVYDADTVRWKSRFADIFTIDPDGHRAVDYTRFHDVAE